MTLLRRLINLIDDDLRRNSVVCPVGWNLT